ncbi:MAG TPA: hypothetical protein VLC07_09275 [Solirubrobacterales bacterium]|nr:hypothetical protein [Solirubrobacterales bacterium]
MTHRDLVSVNECLLFDGYRRAAQRRLRQAKGQVRKAQGRGWVVRRFAAREMECAVAEAQEWGVAGGAR